MEQVMLDMIPTGAKAVCHVSQYDIGRTIRFNLRSGGAVYTLSGTETIKVYIKKPDGTTAERNIANTSSTYVDWVTGEGDCDQAGNCECELVITSGTTVIGSKNFTVKIEEDPYNEQRVVTETAGPAVIATFTTNIVDLLQEVKCEVNATGGNGTPDNPNPINGYTEANITRSGVNLWDEEWEVGNWNIADGTKDTLSDRIRCKNLIPVPANTTLYLCIPSGMSARVGGYKADGTYIGQIVADSAITARSFTTPSDCAYINFNLLNTYGTTYNNDISINYPSTDTTYHAYNGTTYTIAFGQKVYGGTLDVTRGKLHVTHKEVDLGDLNWVNENDTQTGLCRVSTQFTDCVWQSVMICSHYNHNSTTSYTGLSDGDLALTNSESIPLLRIRNMDYSTYTNAQIKAALTGVKLVYQTKTPFDIDLTPEQIEALFGVNNVWHDGNGNTEVKYLYNA